MPTTAGGMAYVWTWLGAFGAAVGVVLLVLAVVVYASARPTWQKRILSLLLALEGVSIATAVGLMYLTDDPAHSYGWQAVGMVFFLMDPFAYLLFLGTIQTRASKVLQVPTVRSILFLGLPAMGVLWLTNKEFFLLGVVPGVWSPWDAVAGPGAPLGLFVLALVSLYGLVVATTAWLRSPHGTRTRYQNAWIAAAFAARDVAFLVSFGAAGILQVEFASVTGVVLLGIAPSAGALVFCCLLSYAVLKAQVLDIDVRIKHGIRHGSVAALFVLAFLIGTQLLQSVTTTRFGPVGGAIAAGLLLFAIRPLERAASRVADAAMPAVQETREYRTRRQEEVFRHALETILRRRPVSPKDRELLAGLARDLAIDPVRAQELERLVLSRFEGPGGARVPAPVEPVPGHARLSSDNVLEQKVRNSVLHQVKVDPGVDASEIQRRVGGGWSTIAYHLTVLEKSGLVSSLVDGRRKRFFPVGQHGPGRRESVAALKNARTKIVFEMLVESPGLMRKELASRVRISVPSMLWHLERLEAAGLIRSEPMGRRIRYYPVKEPSP